MAVDELAASIAADGFYPHEPLLVERQKDGKYVVIEGNRRLATVRLLLDEKLRPQIESDRLAVAGRRKIGIVAPLAGVENNPQRRMASHRLQACQRPAPLDVLRQAEIHRQMREYGHSLPDIAQSIGDNHKTVARLYRALAVIRQAEKMKVFDRDDRVEAAFSFSHLYTGLNYSGIAEFVGLDQESDFEKDAPVPARKSAN